MEVFWKEKSKTITFVTFEMSTEALVGLRRSLQQLVQAQQNQQWSKHLQDDSRSSSPIREMRSSGNCRIGDLHSCSSRRVWIQRQLRLLETINKKPNNAYDMDTMDDDTKALNIKFYSILFSYMKNRPLSLIRQRGTMIPLHLENHSIHTKARLEMVSISKEDDADEVKQRHDCEQWRLGNRPRRKDRGEEEASKDDVTSHEGLHYTPAKRVFVLEGYLSKELTNTSKGPGWHRLPNGVAAYADATADKYLNPEGMINEKWSKRMTLMKKPGQEGISTQIENTKDYRVHGARAVMGSSKDFNIIEKHGARLFTRELGPSWPVHEHVPYMSD